MKDSTQAIARRLRAFPEFLAPLTNAATRYLKYPSTVGEDGVLHIANRPWVAPLNYMFWLYPGISSKTLKRYSAMFSITVPDMYAEVLRHMNGTFSFGMSLCGVPPSMLGNPPLLDRTVLQCHDLATAATEWVQKYHVPREWFHFGTRHYSYSENVGYFLFRAVVSVRGSWSIF